MEAEYASHISAVYDGVRIDELTLILEWADFEGVIGTVWESSSVKAVVRAGLGLGRSEEGQRISTPRSGPKEIKRPAAAAAAERADSTPPTAGMWLDYKKSVSVKSGQVAAWFDSAHEESDAQKCRDRFEAPQNRHRLA